MFAVNFGKFLRKPFLQNTSGSLLLNSDMSKSIVSFFKKSDTNPGSNVESVTNPDDASYGNSVNNINHNNTRTSVISNNSGPSLSHSSIYPPRKSYKFPKTAIGNRGRPCRYQWFQDCKWLHYDERKDCVFC